MQLFFELNVYFQVSKYIVCWFRGSIFKMALYHGGENDVEFVSSCPTLRDSSPTPVDADSEEVLMGYPNIPEPLSQTWLLSRGFAWHASRVSGTQTPQYLVFTSVSQESLDEIDRIPRRGWLLRMTILDDGREESVAHEFTLMFDMKLVLLGVRTSIVATGSGRFGRPAGRSKEADIGYKPCSRDMEDEWLSFVIEVGVSESLAMLRRDAAFWITNSDGKTRIVILLSIDRRDRQILVERWKEVPRTRPNRSTKNYSRIPGMMQSLTLNTNVQYDGPSLEMTAQKLSA
jgi:hypothetical protein